MRANADVIPQDRHATAVSLLAQTLEDLLSAIRVGVQQPRDARLEGIKDTAARAAAPRLEARTRHPRGDRPRVKAQRPGGLRDAQALAIMAVVDPGKRLVSSVSLSTDGNTAIAIVGGPGDTSGQGAAWVYRRSGPGGGGGAGSWAQLGKLVGTGASGAAQQGSFVSLSSDGNTAIVGGPGDNNGQGAAWVYSWSGSVGRSKETSSSAQERVEPRNRALPYRCQPTATRPLSGDLTTTAAEELLGSM